jgi:hypothetical protein
MPRATDRTRMLVRMVWLKMNNWSSMPKTASSRMDAMKMMTRIP